MKKIVSAADLGGAPFTKQDLREVFNDEIWDAIEAILSPFNSDTEGLIVSGCVFTANASNFNMTSGIVYLNGEFMRISAVTNQSFTKYIAPATPTSDSRQFADNTSHSVTQTKNAQLVGSAPGSGQYITVNSLTGANDRRWVHSAGIRVVPVDIGDWDMDSNTSTAVTPGSQYIASNVRGILSVSIRPDTGVAIQSYYDLSNPSNATVMQGGVSWGIATPSNPVVFTLTRLVGGVFDSTDFDATGFNRGIISFLYEG